MKARHREAPPRLFSPRYGGQWVVTSRALLQEISFNHQDFSAANLMLPPAETGPVLIPATFDPPLHDAYRAPLNRHFFPKAIAEHETFIRQTVIDRSEEHTSELQSLMRNSYAVFCLKQKTQNKDQQLP